MRRKWKMYLRFGPRARWLHNVKKLQLRLLQVQYGCVCLAANHTKNARLKPLLLHGIDSFGCCIKLRAVLCYIKRNVKQHVPSKG